MQKSFLFWSLFPSEYQLPIALRASGPAAEGRRRRRRKLSRILAGQCLGDSIRGGAKGVGRRPSRVLRRLRRLFHSPPAFQDICPARSPFRCCEMVSWGLSGEEPRERGVGNLLGAEDVIRKGSCGLGVGPPVLQDSAGGERLDIWGEGRCNVMSAEP